jgi:2-polyprenyl-3-methyl-5-hydroxy-6-metoxy-1,4-benzoquinol methylase
MAELDEVRQFWNDNPLWSGESKYEPGSESFFEEHRNVYISDCFGGSFDLRFLPPPRKYGQEMKILDLGCGVGFWTAEFAMRGLSNLIAADLTSKALEVTEHRLSVYGLSAELREENAESLSFADGTFDHINCQGVIHHTPNTAQCIAEIARVIKPGGTASISVYYQNVAHRLWPFLRWFGYPLAWFGGGLRGRGREQIFLEPNVNEIVRLYDGADNPIGKSYTREQFQSMLESHFSVEEIYFHFFPARALPFPVPKWLHRWLDSHFPFMIYANVHKPCAG